MTLARARTCEPAPAGKRETGLEECDTARAHEAGRRRPLEARRGEAAHAGTTEPDSNAPTGAQKSALGRRRERAECPGMGGNGLTSKLRGARPVGGGRRQGVCMTTMANEARWPSVPFECSVRLGA